MTTLDVAYRLFVLVTSRRRFGGNNLAQSALRTVASVEIILQVELGIEQTRTETRQIDAV